MTTLDSPHSLPVTSASSSTELLPSLHETPAVRHAAQALVDAVRAAGHAPDRALDPAQFEETQERLAGFRGLAPVHPLLTLGTGRGARVRLADGREILDLVSGIGPYVFGHYDQDLLETAAIAAAGDVAFQGRVLPGPEYFRLCERLTKLAGPELPHVWLALSGSMANENAWKMILQKNSPADRAVAFEGAFHGRTVTMAQLTDRPEYRQDLPAYDFVDRIPFYDAGDPESTQKSVGALKAALAKYPGRHAAMCFELVQGEGGFNDAPASFFRALMTCCREAGLAVWVDEIQTFARSRNLFAFRTLGLEDLVDIVTIGKILHGSATLFSPDYCPKPKLVAGTWAGSTVGMAIGARILDRLEGEAYLGSDGRIAQLEARIDQAFADLEERLPGVIRARSGLGAMQGFIIWDGNPAIASELIEVALEEGVLFQTAGKDPMKIRMLPPLNLSDEELTNGFEGLERALRRVGLRHGLIQAE